MKYNLSKYCQLQKVGHCTNRALSCDPGQSQDLGEGRGSPSRWKSQQGLGWPESVVEGLHKGSECRRLKQDPDSPSPQGFKGWKGVFP